MRQPNVTFIRVTTPSPERLYSCFRDSLSRGSCGHPYMEGVARIVSAINACFFRVVRTDEISARWVKGEPLLSKLLLYRQFRQPTTPSMAAKVMTCHQYAPQNVHVPSPIIASTCMLAGCSRVNIVLPIVSNNKKEVAT